MQTTPSNGTTDPLTPQERSVRMSLVKSSGNKSTELAVANRLLEAGLSGWERHPSGLIGKPDFYFPDVGLIVFVDGCFWHACPTCARRIPRTRSDFWQAKIDENRRRDIRQRRALRRQGYHVMRIWEHEVRRGVWLRRLVQMLNRLTPSRLAIAESTDNTYYCPPGEGDHPY